MFLTHIITFGALLSSTTKGILDKVLLLCVAILAPVAAVVYAVMFLILIDLVVGVAAAIKQKEKITSAKLSRTISKLIVYLISILVTHIISEYLLVSVSLGISLTAIIAGFIGITELKSIIENLNRLCGQTALKDVVLYLSNERNRKLLGPKTCIDCPLLQQLMREQKKIHSSPKKPKSTKKKDGTK